MLSGHPPFYSKSEEKLKQKICSMKYNFDLPVFSRISEDIKDLIKKILVKADERPTIARFFKIARSKKTLQGHQKNLLQLIGVILKNIQN